MLLGAGRDADVFALDDGRVLRRYRDGSDATVEAEVMRYVAAHGYPVPEVFAATGPDLVLERVDGPTMADAVQDGELDVDGAGRMLADLHERLHGIASRAHRTSEERVIHMDLHPLNVMVAPRGPVVIDWCNARDGEPGLDVAMSALILAQVALVAAPVALFWRGRYSRASSLRLRRIPRRACLPRRLCAEAMPTSPWPKPDASMRRDRSYVFSLHGAAHEEAEREAN